ncbi:hypothetical protein Q9L58_005111 [Maublancomyces gigas]|uniref:Glutathione S-transferase n=1 Tax=Discina gigas TaxID=1032678 RepID=A0ABR3GJ74_9PEZI
MSKIILYTNANCPFAQRAHIVLAELGLKYESVSIDLSVPREPWYLKINPRGLVPAVKYGEHLLVESQVISQFFVDLKASHLLPSSGSVDGALARARVNFFNDTFATKVQAPFFGSLTSPNEADRATKATQFLDAIENDIVPLLKDAAPFFGGSKELTLAEVNAAPLVVRFLAYAKSDTGLLPAFVEERLNSITIFQAWAKAIAAHKSVSEWYDEKANVEQTQKRIFKLRA